MTTAELLSQLRALNVKVWAQDGELKVSAPKGALTAELREDLAQHKQALLAVLSTPTQEPARPITPVSRDEPLPLSFTQQRVWFLEELDPGLIAYNIWIALRLKGELDEDALERAIAEIVRRHEILRTRFPDTDGVPRQEVAPPGGFEMRRVRNEGGLTEEAWRAEVQTFLERESQRTMDLKRGPLFEATLVRVHETEHVLFVLTHHIVFDGLSKGLFLRELTALYEAFLAGRPSPLPELPAQFADYAVWQREFFAAGELERQLGYWGEVLSGDLPVLELPTDHARPAVQTHSGAQEWRKIDWDLIHALEELAQREGATLFVALLAVYEVLLSRYTGLKDLIVGTAMGNRTRAEIEDLIGFFVNTLVLRTDLSGSPGFRGVLRRVRSSFLGAIDHQDMPFEKLVEELSPERSLSYSPIFQTMFVLDQDTGESRRMANFELEQYDLGAPVARMDLIFQGLRERENFWLWAEYNTDLFERETIVRMQQHFVNLLRAIVADPERPIEELELLGEDERRTLLVERNATAADYEREAPVHALVEAQADRTPHATALVFPEDPDGGGGIELTYAELDARSNQLAHHLMAEGVRPGDLVGLCVQRSADMVVALLGVWKAGAAYVPLDPGFPLERLAYMVEDAGLEVVVARTDSLECVPEGVRTVLLDRDAERVAARPDTRPGLPVAPDERAYVIYTSGSTGRPKGVVIEHRPVANFLATMARAPGLGPADRLLAVTTLSFDISVLELLLPLVTGATVIVAPKRIAAQGDRLARAITELRPSVVQATPATWRMLLLGGWPGDPALKVLCGGEALTRELADELLTRCRELWNVYGPTEATIWSTCCRVAPGTGPITIGRPIGNTRVYVLDERLEPTPIGVPGELWIAGDGLARGYLDRPELTEERFRSDPFAPGERMYRTGDLARWRADGDVECLGRTDHQIKLRGFRIELGEIDAVIEESTLVSQCATVLREDQPGDQRLVAYLVPVDGAEPTAAELREHAQQRLPAYMVPAAFVVLDELPLTPNKKVDRGALAARKLEQPTVETEYVAPRNEEEERIAAIWAEVLGAERVGVHDDFFELGGNSLLTTQVMARLRTQLGADLPLRAMFEEATVAALARRLGAAAPADVEEIPRLAGDEPAALSFAQERLWFLDQLEPGRATYNMWIARRLRGALDTGALESSLAEIVRRHEVLRARFELVDGTPRQVIASRETIRLEQLELGAGDDAGRLLEAWAGEPFDLAQGPLLRARLLRLADDEHVLFVVAHHTVVDGLSIGLLLDELRELYAAFARDEPSPLAELPIQYADYAAWQRERLSGEERERQMAYWRERLAGDLPVLELPTDRPRPAIQTYVGAVEKRAMDRGLVDRLAELAGAEGATLFMALTAAYDALLNRFTGQEDLIVGTAVGNRGRTETERVIGFFANTLALRVDLSGDPSFRELLARVRESALGALDHQELPFERLVDELQPERNLSYTPVYQTLFVVDEDLGEGSRMGDLAVDFVDLDIHVARTDLTLLNYVGTAGLVSCAEYNTDLFDRGTVAHLLACFETLLRSAVAAPDTPLSHLGILPPGEREQLLGEWIDTRTDWPRGSTIQREFEIQVARTPDAIAAVFASLEGADEEITYAELNRRANRVAHRLRELGVGRDELVGLCTARTLPMLVGILGILKAGGAYVPLDPGYPEERLAFMIEDAELRVLLAQRALRDELPAFTGEVLDLDAPAAFDGYSDEDPEHEGATGDLAYVMFTSGSTGRPKGVCVEHRSVLRLVSHPNFAHLGPDETLLHFAPISFDASTLEVWGALLRGGRMVVYPPSEPSLEDLGRVIREYGVTTAWLTAGLFSLMVEHRLDDLRGLRQLLAGGDVLPVQQVNRVLEELPDLRLVNGYGPTENTTFTCCHQISEGGPVEVSVPIGRPVSDTRVYILDRHLQPVPIGVFGELYAGGDGVARGYLKRPELTDERFLPDPHAEDRAARMYTTGDVVRWRPDGAIEFQGRRDNQVKVRGFRIELGEIEAELGAVDGVRECVVIVREDAPGDKRIVAYLVPEGAAPESSALREHVKAHLPDYMVPAHFVTLDALPLSPNGKVDRKALPAPDPARDVEADYAEPRDETERRIAEIWRDVLSVERVGIRDSFFELGGNSLLTTLAMSRVREAFDRQIPLRELFQEPTVEGLAARIRPGGDDVTRRSYQETFDACLIPLQPRGSKTPLFLVSGAHEDEDHFLRFVGSLLPYMGSNQPIYGFKARGLDGVHEPHGSAEEMARDYVQEMRELQPQGPYLLAGNCVGGIVAYAMAQELRRQGQEVALVAMLDTTCPGEGYEAFVEEHYRFWKLSRFTGHFAELKGLSVTEKLGYVLGKVGKKLRRRFPLTEAMRRRTRIESVERQYSKILARYAPDAYDGHVVLIANEELQRILPDGGWRGLVGEGLVTHVVPGDHVTRLSMNGEVTAELLRGCIDASLNGQHIEEGVS